jgi:hypothetical protein
MTTLNPATRLSSAELAVTRAGPQIRVRLPAGGWQVGFRVQHDGRTVIEVTCPPARTSRPSPFPAS